MLRSAKVFNTSCRASVRAPPGAGGSLSEERVWKRSVQSVVREALLREREMQAASDKAAFWRACRDDVLKDFLLVALLLDRTAADPGGAGCRWG